ncbi:MAG TPA: NlpC/P60 family protein [Cellulomonas sp.]
MAAPVVAAGAKAVGGRSAAAKAGGRGPGRLVGAGGGSGDGGGKRRRRRRAAVTVVAAVMALVSVFLAPLVALVVLLGGAFSLHLDTEIDLSGLSNVPADMIEWVRQAGEQCPQVPSSLIAGQIDVESSWNPEAVSTTGAQGLAQFMPATWDEWGIDADGDGAADPFTAADAIMTQAAYLCDLVARAAQLPDATGEGETMTLALMAYSTGWGRISTGERPQAGVQYAETVLAASILYLWLELGADDQSTAASGSAVVDAAMQWVGYPYVWGGGGTTGPSGTGSDGRGPGFDCSGLVQYALFHGAGVSVTHLADSQARDTQGTVIARDFSEMQPGDIVAFSSSGGARYQHIGIYIGAGQMVHAPTTGKDVQVVDLRNNSYYGAMTWSIRRFA